VLVEKGTENVDLQADPRRERKRAYRTQGKVVVPGLQRHSSVSRTRFSNSSNSGFMTSSSTRMASCEDTDKLAAATYKYNPDNTWGPAD